MSLEQADSYEQARMVLLAARPASGCLLVESMATSSDKPADRGTVVMDDSPELSTPVGAKAFPSAGDRDDNRDDDKADDNVEVVPSQARRREPEVPTKAPMAALVGTPRRPLPTHFTKPRAPSFSAPWIGWRARPPRPDARLLAKALPPAVIP